MIENEFSANLNELKREKPNNSGHILTYIYICNVLR